MVTKKKNRGLWAGVAAFAAAVALVVGGQAVAQASPPPAVHSSTASVAAGTGVYATLVRSQNALTASNGVYTNLSSTNAWWLDEDGGFTFDSTGLHVPSDGLYLIQWEVLLTYGANGIVGVAIDNATPNGGILAAIGPVVSNAAATGNGSETIWLPAGTTLDLWGYGAGSSMAIQPLPSNASQWSVTLLQ
jgi:hypothetical protein